MPESAYDFYVLRNPVYPIAKLQLLNTLTASGYEKEKNPELKLLFSDPIFLEGIYLASKELYILLVSCLDGKNLDDDKAFNMIKSLHKYYTRMCMRCTPYGLFAGCSTGPMVLIIVAGRFIMKKKWFASIIFYKISNS